MLFHHIIEYNNVGQKLLILDNNMFKTIYLHLDILLEICLTGIQRSINRDKKCCKVRLADFLRVLQLAVKKLVNLFTYVYLHRTFQGKYLQV